MTNHQELVERVARAIYEVDPHLNAGEPVPWDHLRGPLRKLALKQATAAIDALSDPKDWVRIDDPHS